MTAAVVQVTGYRCVCMHVCVHVCACSAADACMYIHYVCLSEWWVSKRNVDISNATVRKGCYVLI